MAKKINVLFAAFEASPFIKTGGLGDVAGSLPAALKGKDCEIRVILPKLRQIPAEYRDKMKKLSVFTVPLGWRNQYCGIETLKVGTIQYYFVDNEFYFYRDAAYGYGDDCERVAFFSKAILECLMHLDGFFPDVIHCNDWHTALVPVFLHEQYRQIAEYQHIHTVLTIHNLKFQGICGEFALGDLLALHNCKNAADQLRWHDDAINFLQGGLYYTDYITTVSPTYAGEICTWQYGEGLDGVLSGHRERLAGILNGIDTEILPGQGGVSLLHGRHDGEGKVQGRAPEGTEPAPGAGYATDGTDFPADGSEGHGSSGLGAGISGASGCAAGGSGHR